MNVNESSPGVSGSSGTVANRLKRQRHPQGRGAPTGGNIARGGAGHILVYGLLDLAGSVLDKNG